MPRPTSKAQLLDQSRANYEKLQATLAPLSPEQMTEGGMVGEWSVKDVLAHLIEWQKMCLGWYETGKRGETPITPSEKYTWRQIPELNQAIYEAHQDDPLEDVLSQFQTSHDETMALIETLTDEELFTPKVYKWTKTTTLGAYFISATSSHYDWARKEIRRGLKAKSQS